MKNKRLLYTASSNRHLLHFHMPYISMLEKMGVTVDILSSGNASDFPNNTFFNIPFYKKILSSKNISIISKIKKILTQNDYDVIVLNTALTAALVRLALPEHIKETTRVINICHGYFFGENVSTSKNKLYMSIEKRLANKTDDIIVMNTEDEAFAKKLKLCTQNVFFVHGMGYDPKKYFDGIKALNNSQTIDLLYVAEHSTRKNHKELLTAMANAVKQGTNLTLSLAGDGKLMEENRRLVKTLGLADRVKFLGFLDYIVPAYAVCDYVVSPSKIEGLPFNIMEALACAIPCVVSDIKGHRDLITNEENGYTFAPGDIDRLTQILNGLQKNTRTYMRIQASAVESVKPYTIDATKKEFADIYRQIIK